jgi:Glycosyl hydrolases family 25
MHRLSHAAPRPVPRLLRLFGAPRLVAVLLALTILPLAAGLADASSPYTANCGVNLRSRPTTSATIRKVIKVDTVVTVSERVSGGWYKADCAKYVSGSYWYKITAIGGRSVSSLLGVSAVYGASGLFRPSSGGYSEGIDVSKWQGTIDFAKVRASGRRFVIAKATEGNTYTDATYAHNKAYAMANGLHFGGYHFARPGTNSGDAASEADHFVSVLGLKHGMMVPALDLEVSGGLSQSQLITWTKTFVARVYARTGARPMIYSSPSFWSTYMANTSWFAATATGSCGSPTGARPRRRCPAPTGAAAAGRSGSTPTAAASPGSRAASTSTGSRARISRE